MVESSYFDGAVQRGFVSLYASRFFLSVALGLLGLFVPIFLFELFEDNFIAVVLYFSVINLLYALLLPWCMPLINRLGFRNALRLSVFFGAGIYTTYFVMNTTNLWWSVPLAIFLTISWRIFYWTPHHVDFVKFTDHKNRGREISLIMATKLLFEILLPAVAGFIIAYYSFNVLFGVAIVVLLLSGLPYITIPETYERFEWGVLETWKMFFSRIRKRMCVGYIAFGAESFIALFVWPIFIFMLLSGDYFRVGVLSTLVISVSVLFQLASGTFIDKRFSKESFLKVGSMLYAIGWLIKIFIVTAFHIFVVGIYHNIARIFAQTPFHTLTYEASADEGHFVDEFTVMKEIVIQCGRLIAACLIIPLALYVSLQWVFVIAALASVGVTLIRAHDVRFLQTHF